MTRRKWLTILSLFGLGSCVKAQRREPVPIALQDATGREHYAHGRLDKLGTRLVYARHQIAPQMQRLFPYAICGRCELPWPLLREHSTVFSDSEGCFPLCEDCWSELMKPEYRMPYYMAMVDMWVKDYAGYKDKYPKADNPETKREAIRHAVLKEPTTTTYNIEESL